MPIEKNNEIVEPRNKTTDSKMKKEIKENERTVDTVNQDGKTEEKIATIKNNNRKDEEEPFEKRDLPSKSLAPSSSKVNETSGVEQSAVDSREKLKISKKKVVTATSKQKTSKVVKDTKKTKEISKKKDRSVKDQEIPDKKQTTLTQHFQVRRSERKPKAVEKEEVRLIIEKRILNGDEGDLEIRVIDDKGRGIFSTRNLKKGDLVCEYAGDLIDIKEANKREDEYSKDPEFGCYMYYFVYNNSKYCVDATKESGRLGRLLNHSKTKNNVTTTLFPINDIPHLILVAKRDISQGEELLYDYGDRSKSSLESHPWLKT